MYNPDDIEALTRFFYHYQLKDEKIIKSIQGTLEPIMIDNKSIIFVQNKPAQSLFFLPRGIARYYVVDSEGQEHTKSFRLGPAFLGSIYAIHGGKVNPFTAEIIQASSLYSLDIKYWQALLENNHLFIKFYNNLLAELFIEKEKRELSFLQDSAEDRYRQFQQDYAQYIDDIPKWMIASYLGITPEALSRIRKRASGPP